LDNEDYVEGYTVEPSKRWISQFGPCFSRLRTTDLIPGKEQKRFREDYTANKEEERKQKERAERKKAEALAAKKAVGVPSLLLFPLF
jgi:hypothetical protein